MPRFEIFTGSPEKVASDMTRAEAALRDENGMLTETFTVDNFFLSRRGAKPLLTVVVRLDEYGGIS